MTRISQSARADEERLRVLSEYEERRARRRVGLSLLVAVLLHGVVLLPLLDGWLFRTDTARQATRMSLRMYRGGARSSEMAKRPSLPAQTDGSMRAPNTRPPPPPRPPEPIPTGKLVTLPPSSDAPPEKADHLAATDHRTERETRSRHARADWTDPAHAPTGAAATLRAPPVAAPTARAARDASGRAQFRSATPGRDQSAGGNQDSAPASGDVAASGARAPRAGAMAVDSMGSTEAGPLALAARPPSRLARLMPDAKGRMAPASPAPPPWPRLGASLQLRLGASAMPADGQSGGVGGRAARASGGGQEGGLPGLADLTPSLAELTRLAGGPANDYLPEVETDAATRLNAWRWKHAPFFDRMKQAISRNWRGGEVYRQADPTRQVYGATPIVTVLVLTLDREGKLVRLQVQDPSASRVLDEEALRATRAAGPFPNPPSALFGGRETISFPFGFVITSEWRHIDLNWRP